MERKKNPVNVTKGSKHNNNANKSSFISVDKIDNNKNQSPEKNNKKSRSKSRGKRNKSEDKSQDKNKSSTFNKTNTSNFNKSKSNNFDKTKSGTMIIADPLTRIKALKIKRKPKKAN